MEILLRGVRRHGIGLLAVVVGTLFGVASMTSGTFALFVPNEGFTSYYDSLGDSMLDGRMDVPPEDIGSEAFLLRGKTYGYFGATPAFFRMPLNLFFPSLRGRWGPLMMTVWCFATLLGAYTLLLQARRAVRGDRPVTLGGSARYVDAAFVLCVAFGTTLLFMMQISLLYHEATLTGAALAVWAYIALVAYFERGKTWQLVAAIVIGLLAFQARSSVGGGPMMALGLAIGAVAFRAILTTLRARRGSPAPRAEEQADDALARDKLGTLVGLPTPAPRKLARQAVLAAVMFGLLSSAIFYRNIVTYGSLTGLPSLKYHVQLMANPERLAITGGRFLQPINVRTMAYNLLNPATIRYLPKYPFLYVQRPIDVRRFPESRLDWLESHWSLTGGYPFWCVLAVLGSLLAVFPWLAVSGRIARFRIPLFASFAAGITIMVSSAITQRYLHDAFPFLLVAGALGFECLRAARRDRRWARWLTPVVAVLGLYTCYASLALSSPGWQR